MTLFRGCSLASSIVPADTVKAVNKELEKELEKEVKKGSNDVAAASMRRVNRENKHHEIYELWPQ